MPTSMKLDLFTSIYIYVFDSHKKSNENQSIILRLKNKKTNICFKLQFIVGRKYCMLVLNVAKKMAFLKPFSKTDRNDIYFV